MKEVRIWNRSKSDLNIYRGASSYVIGTEGNLITYLPLNEAVGSYGYDRSRSSPGIFNRNHARLSSETAWINDSPTTLQLALASYTDANGNYTMKLPYINDGENYQITPIYLTHTFSPASKTLFIGDGVPAVDAVDFEDVSSFPVTGRLFYKNTTCAVEGASIKIDNNIIIKNGSPVQTDAGGSFDILVPIGAHIITVEKPGHVFNQGRFPSEGVFDFQEPLSGIEFRDSTLVRVVGRVVGGNVEAAKKPGLGLSKNNIGKAHILLKAQQGNGCIESTVITNDSTGEYTIALPPLKYMPSVSIPTNMPLGFGTLDLVNLSATPMTTTVTDTLYDTAGEVVSVRSVSYEKQLDYLYRVKPQLIVKMSDGVTDFIGDTTYTYLNRATKESITKNLKTDPLRWPVFTSTASEQYTALIKAFELYTNYDNNKQLFDSVATTDGTLRFNNQISTTPIFEVELKDVNFSDTTRFLVYKFTAGEGNLLPHTGIPEYSFTKTFGLDLITADGMAIPWQPVQPAGLATDRSFRGFVFTPKIASSEFVTNGPEVVDFVLRDPPGSNSNSTMEISKSDTRSAEWSWSLGTNVTADDAIQLGFQATLGVPGNGSDIENYAQLQLGVEIGISGGNDGSFSTTTTNTKEWATDGSSTNPGAQSDLFIGKSQNFQFGITQALQFTPMADCGVSVECIGPEFGGLRAAKITGLAIEPQDYATTFIYSQFHLITQLIPDLTRVRNALLINSSDKYTSKLDVSDPNYGRNNDDPVFGMMRDTLPSVNGIKEYTRLDGPSYKFNGTGTQNEQIETDSVRLINKQIGLWEQALRDNEWEKANVANQDTISALRAKELGALQAEYQHTINAYGVLQALNVGVLIGANIAAAIPIPGLAAVSGAFLGVSTGLQIATAEIAQEFNKFKEKEHRLHQRFDQLGKATNYSISSGNSFTSSIAHDQVGSYTRTLEFAHSFTLGAELKAINGGNGFILNRSISLDFEQSRSWGNETASSETVSFTLADEDKGDFYSVDVYQSIFGWGPIFKRRAGGATSCPYEGEEVSKYYNPGTKLSEATVRVDDFGISASPTILTNIPADQSAVFNLTIENKSTSPVARDYIVEVYGETNQHGAIARFDGVSGSTAVFMNRQTSLNKVLTIEKGAGPVYQYNNIEVAVYAGCEPLVSKVVSLSAHFIPTCTDASLANPEDQWILNNSFHDTMPVAIKDYNINQFGLQRLRFDYKSTDNASWTALESFYKDTTGLMIEDASLIPSASPFVSYNWEVDQLTDGAYDLRVVSICDEAESVSATHRGYIDRINPHAFGSPSPGDGILSPNDDILLRMNELVETGSITSLNFDVRGVLNGGEIRHSTSVAFDGTGDHAAIPAYQLQQRSVTLEFWLQRSRTGVEVLLSQGAKESEAMVVSFDASNQIVWRLGDQSVTSTRTVDDQEWHHVTLIYDQTKADASIIIDFALQGTNNDFNIDYVGAGAIQVGATTFTSSTRSYQGMIHELRLWNVTRTLGEIASSGNISLIGREPGLVGYWPLSEGYGGIAGDKVRGRHAVLNGTTWSILPSNHAFTFDGVDDYLSASAGDLAFNTETDMTIEAWFKTGTSSVQSILSNGKADRPSKTSWDLFLDASGKVNLQNFGTTISSRISYNDNNWHHVSVVIERTRAITLYIDGALISTGNAIDYNGFGGQFVHLGVRAWIEAGMTHRDQYFNGALDDIRIWNVARTPEQVQRDFLHQLRGDEPGLKVYYPFDGVTNVAGITIRSPTREDISTSSYDLSLAAGMTDAYSTDAPPVQLPRLIEKVNHTYSINGDEIYIELTDPPARLENVTLDITVSRIKDKAGNIMQSPETWIAYIDKNQVFWEDEYFNYTKKKDESLSFTSKIKNTGGRQERFTLSNLPRG